MFWVATAPTVYGIETMHPLFLWSCLLLKLQQHLPFTVLKHKLSGCFGPACNQLQQHLPFTVLKLEYHNYHHLSNHRVATAPTVYGIETGSLANIIFRIPSCNSIYRLRYWNVLIFVFLIFIFPLQQHLPFTVCAEGCETAEEQSDDEGRTSQVPERSEGKTKLMR